MFEKLFDPVKSGFKTATQTKQAKKNQKFSQKPNSDALQLSNSFIMCKTKDDLHKWARWDGKNGKSRHLVLSNLGSKKKQNKKK